MKDRTTQGYWTVGGVVLSVSNGTVGWMSEWGQALPLADEGYLVADHGGPSCYGGTVYWLGSLSGVRGPLRPASPEEVAQGRAEADQRAWAELTGRTEGADLPTAASPLDGLLWVQTAEGEWLPAPEGLDLEEWWSWVV